jgi:hypothetical protein
MHINTILGYVLMNVWGYLARPSAQMEAFKGKMTCQVKVKLSL